MFFCQLFSLVVGFLWVVQISQKHAGSWTGFVGDRKGAKHWSLWNSKVFVVANQIPKKNRVISDHELDVI